MKHSDYINLTGRLGKLTREANRTRSLLTMSVEVMPDGAIVATSTPDQEHTPVDIDRAGIWRAVTDIDTDTVRIMDEAVDGWTDENQGRADRGLVPTADVLNLYSAMSGFLVATDTPAGRWGVLYERTRGRVRAWMDQAVAWFPDLIDQGTGKPTDQVPADTNDHVARRSVTPAIDRDRLMACFQVPFTRSDTNTGSSKFDSFYNDLIKRATAFSTMDYCRVARQVWRSKFIVIQKGRMKFAKWLREFLDICGVDMPADPSPSRYKKTQSTDLSVWLE